MPYLLMPFGYVLPNDLYLVVYPHQFAWLQCDDGDATIALDVLDSTGTYIDGVVACPKCLPSDLESIQLVFSA